MRSRQGYVRHVGFGGTSLAVFGRLALAIAVAIGASQVASAAVVIEVPTYYMLPGTSLDILANISTTSSDVIDGIILAMQIGQGGPENLGPDVGPQFVGDLDIIGPGTVFAANNWGANVDSLGSRMRYADTLTMPETAPLLAEGMLGRIAVTTTLADEGTWTVKLSGVAQNTPAGAEGLNTDVLTEQNDPPIALTLVNGELRVWSLHDLTWSKGADGTWAELGSWAAGALPAHAPNITTRAVIDTPHQVTLGQAGQTDTLRIADGQLTLTAAAQLAVTTELKVEGSGIVVVQGGAVVNTPSLLVTSGGHFTLAADAQSSVPTQVQVQDGAVMTVESDAALTTPSLLVTSGGQFDLANGAQLLVGAELKVENNGLMTVDAGADFSTSSLLVSSGGHFTTGAALIDTPIVVDGGTLECLGLEASTGWTGGAVVGGSAPSVLIASYIIQDTLTIGANGLVELRASGAAVPEPTGGLTGAAVPEPGTLLLLVAATIAAALAWRRR